MPWGSRAAYRVSSFIHTKQKAPRSIGSTSSARSSSPWSGWWAISAVTRLVSLVEVSPGRWARSSSPSGPGSAATASRSSWVLMRLPLWPSAIEPSGVGRKVGWALCQVLAPVVE